MKKRLFVAFIIGLLVPQSVFLLPTPVGAQSEIEKLQNQIEDRNSRLDQIQAEIAQYEAQLQEVGAEKQTLQAAINRLETERKKITAEISRTENLIASTDLQISKLLLEIDATEEDIDTVESAIAAIIRAEYKISDNSLIELLLSEDNLSAFWSTYDAHENVRGNLAQKVLELDSYKTLMEEKQNTNVEKRGELSSLRDQYSEQNEVLLNNRAEQTELLNATKNEERTYQQLLAEKEAAREQILKELRAFESELQFILDPSTVPTAGTAVFAWPLKSIIITQYFGGTEFAARNAAAYGGRAHHPGVDFGAPRGTPIYAPLSGTVRATGNTDAVPGCYSWGKWTLIDHANGLTTLYAHQDVIGVSPGQKVSTGEIIGYVGNTGFSTGPHLHFTVYAKEGVSVRQFNQIKTVTSCGAATTPVAATEAYIDPMLYLPAY